MRIFVTATDTGVGKTQAAAAFLSLLWKAGQAPAAFKPYESGCEGDPSDAAELKRAAHSEDPLEVICPHQFKEPLAPGIAARRQGVEPSFKKTLAAFRRFEGRALVAEGAGGLFVPIDSERQVIDLIAALKLPVLLVARAGLGTLNHTALSLGALAGRGIPVQAVLLSKGQPDADLSEEDNAAEIARLNGVRVLGPVPYLAQPAKRRAAFERALSPLLS